LVRAVRSVSSTKASATTAPWFITFLAVVTLGPGWPLRQWSPAVARPTAPRPRSPPRCVRRHGQPPAPVGAPGLKPVDGHRCSVYCSVFAAVRSPPPWPALPPASSRSRPSGLACIYPLFPNPAGPPLSAGATSAGQCDARPATRYANSVPAGGSVRPAEGL
jgi:hypothetical protein